MMDLLCEQEMIELSIQILIYFFSSFSKKCMRRILSRIMSSALSLGLAIAIVHISNWSIYIRTTEQTHYESPRLRNVIVLTH